MQTALSFQGKVVIKSLKQVEEARDLKTGARVNDKSGYLHKDIRGSVVATSSMDASQPAKFTSGVEYDPWGNMMMLQGQKVPVHNFIDHEAAPGLGYYHFGARIYDPSLRRWLSPDPLINILPELDENDGLQLNLYGYAANNPVRYIDSDGNFAMVAWLPILVIPSAASIASIAAPIAIVVVAVAATYFVQKNKEAIVEVAKQGVKVLSKLPPPPGGDDTVCPSCNAQSQAQQAKLAKERAQEKAKGQSTPAQPPQQKKPSPPANSGTAKPHGKSDHDQKIDDKIAELKKDSEISNIRKNQAQVDANGNKVGNNRPDIQYDKNGKHYCIEYDRNKANGDNHEVTIKNNDPNAVIILHKL